jgi:hypothetical protein
VERRVGGGRDGLAIGVEPRPLGLAPRPLRHQALQRHARLEGRLPLAARVEVGARAEHELLSGQRPLAAGEDRREALLGRLHGAPRPPPGAREFPRGLVAPAGHRLAVAIADADDQRVLGRKVRRVGGGGGHAVGVQRPVQHAQRLAHRALARRGEPGVRLVGRVEGRGAHDGRAGGHRLGSGPPDLPAATAAPEAPPRRAERREHEHGLQLALRLGVAAGALRPYQIPAVARPQQEPELELDEAEAVRGPATRPGGRRSPASSPGARTSRASWARQGCRSCSGGRPGRTTGPA